MNRRELLKWSLVASATQVLAKSTPIAKNKKQRVIVCGGGYGGLTTAKYLKVFNPNLEVLLIEKNSHFLSCPYSNLWLGGVDGVSLRDLSFNYLSAAQKFGYEFINETIVKIQKEKKQVITHKNSYHYDYLILSTGIEYDYSKLFQDPQKSKKVYTLYPPAMKPGSEHLLLKKKIENFKGGKFILNVPSGTYRCPPAPYERACMIAYYFKTHNIKAKVILIDPRDKPGAKAKGFLSSFNELYEEYIEYLPMTEIKDIDFEQKKLLVESFDKTTVEYLPKEIPFEDASIIPNMKPSSLIEDTGLKLTKKGWAKLKTPTFESVTDENILVVGDSNGYPYPKSGHMANSCGYLAAKQLAYKTLGKHFPYEKELPSNICYSLVNGSPKEGISVHHNVSYSEKKGIKISSNSTPKKDQSTGESIQSWYNAITYDMFG
jgi:NADPH-dependent 2,4-dienoyl-CoA reductase/sulfur reductase-like enzyme